ncbi:MAG: sugar kinase [Victivallales bacterium]|nr:sugar kinase [Victivallales bacterium]
MDKVIAGFGEVMLRLCPPGRQRFAQALPGTLQATFGGGEANVCASVAMLGGKARFLTALPDNTVARALVAQLRGLGCDVSRIHYTEEGRMGVYYAELGSNMRGSSVLYDREGSVVASLPLEAYDFGSMLEGVGHLHLTGITPALSRNAFEVTHALALKAVEKGITLSVDLNYRKKLWNWEAGTPKRRLAERCMEKIVSVANFIIGNEEDALDVFGIGASGIDVESGKLNADGYQEVAERLAQRFPHAKFIAFTLRESYSADHNNWGGMIYDCQSKATHFAPMDDNGCYVPYQIHSIVDRFGGGDSFCAGLLFALHTPELAAPETAIRFAVAASALKHTCYGDFNYSTRCEVENLMRGFASGRVQR